MSDIKVVHYVQADGTDPFGDWFNGLDAQAAAKVRTAVARLEEGNTSNVKRLGSIAEFKIDWGPGYRLYIGRDGDKLILLLVGGTKKTQERDIKYAEQLFAEYKMRKAKAMKDEAVAKDKAAKDKAKGKSKR
jgi:putative addiction module killer protein